MTGRSPSLAIKTFDLGSAPPPRLLFALLHQRFTGTIQLEQQGSYPGQRTIWFEGGMPVFTDWFEPSEVLGQVLIGIQSIDEAELHDALERMTQQPGLLGETLMKMGALDVAQLRMGLMRQCGRKLTRLFAYQSGLVTVAAHTHELDALERVNTLELILNGILRHYDAARISHELGPLLTAPVQATAALARYQSHFHIRSEDLPILQALQHGTTLDDLVRQGRKPLRCAQYIYLLWACQMLRHDVVPSTATSSSAVSGPYIGREHPSGPSRGESSPTTESEASRDAPLPSASAPSRSGPLPSASGPETNDDFEARLQQLEEKIQRRAHAFDLLGLEPTAERKDIRAAWSELSRQMHPDALVARKLVHLRERVGAVFAALSEAHAVLSNREQREALQAKLAMGQDPTAEMDPAAVARAAFESEVIAKEAERYLRANHFERALERYSAALALNPAEPDWRAASAWCTFCLSKRPSPDALQAEHTLMAICTEYPNQARPHYFRGLVLRDLGNTGAALAAFDEAARLDTRLIDAERQARAIRLQTKDPATKSPSEKKGRGLMGFFKR